MSKRVLAGLLFGAALFAAPSASAESIPYYNSRGDVVGAVGSFKEFLDRAEERGSRISFGTPEQEAENFAQMIMSESSTPAYSFAILVFAKDDCGVRLHPMVSVSIEYFRQRQPVQLAYEIEKARITARPAKQSFCNVARAGVDNMARTFDNLLFWRPAGVTP